MNICYSGGAHNGLKFQEIEKVPVPSGKYTGIGSRVLSDTAVKEVKKLYLPLKI